MAATKALRDTFGLSQQEIAYFIGASRFQVYSHEKTLNKIAEPQEEVLKRIYLLFSNTKIFLTCRMFPMRLMVKQSVNTS